MTLLITIFAAVISTIVWYLNAPKSEMQIGVLCRIYWGASIMWFVDAIFEYIDAGAEFFVPASGDMLNDSYLGMSVVALGLVIWLAILLFKDPKGVVKATILREAGVTR